MKLSKIYMVVVLQKKKGGSRSNTPTFDKSADSKVDVKTEVKSDGIFYFLNHFYCLWGNINIIKFFLLFHWLHLKNKNQVLQMCECVLVCIWLCKYMGYTRNLTIYILKPHDSFLCPTPHPL